MVRPAPFVVAVGLLLAGCSGGGDDDDASAAASPPTAPASSTPSSSAAHTTTGAADPYAIPEVIDAAYVNRVLEALYAVDGDVTREILRTREIGNHALSRLGAIYGEPQLTVEIEGLPSVLQGDPSRFRDPPGDRRFQVRSLIAAEPDCVIVLTNVDLSNVAVTPPTLASTEAYLLALVPTGANSEREELNPTPWRIVDAEVVSASKPVSKAEACG